jgi:hypothetical protein
MQMVLKAAILILIQIHQKKYRMWKMMTTTMMMMMMMMKMTTMMMTTTMMVYVKSMTQVLFHCL